MLLSREREKLDLILSFKVLKGFTHFQKVLLMSEKNYSFLLNSFILEKSENYFFLLIKVKTFKRKKTVRDELETKIYFQLLACSAVLVVTL